jgi:hypothetical protein
MPGRLPSLLRSCALACLLATHASAQSADTATRDQARSLGMAGVEAYQSGRYDAASEKLERAYGLMNVPSLGLWSARALAKRNVLVEAANRYYEVASLQVPVGDAAVQHQAQLDAQAELEQLRPQIPRLVVRVTAADTSELALSLDGRPMPSSTLGKARLVNPGAHHVEARLGAEQRASDVTLLMGKEAAVALDFSQPATGHGAEPKPAAPSPQAGSGRRTLAWATLGAGGVGVALGGVMAGLALGKRSSLKDSGCTTTCPHAQQAEVDRLDTFRITSGVGFIAGGVLATTGIVLLLTSPSSEQQVGASFTGHGVNLTGRF